MRRILLVVLVGAIAFVAALLVTVFLLWPSAPAKRPVLADNPPLKAATRTSVMIAPAAIALGAIRDVMDAQAPRDLSGKRDNPVGQLLQGAELGWTITRGPLAVTGRAEGLAIVAPLNGRFRLTGQIGQQVGNLTNQLGGLLGGSLGEKLGNLAGSAVDQRAEVRGNVTLNTRPALQPNWRIEPNLTCQANIGNANLSIRRSHQCRARGEAAARSVGERADRGAAGAGAQRSFDRGRGAARVGEDVPRNSAREGRPRRAGSVARGASDPGLCGAAEDRRRRRDDHGRRAGGDAHRAR